jgi:hypothetical protein
VTAITEAQVAKALDDLLDDEGYVDLQAGEHNWPPELDAKIEKDGCDFYHVVTRLTVFLNGALDETP